MTVTYHSLGVASLISIDRFLCPFCWIVPTTIRISWNHQDGEQRLYLEGPEVVMHAGLAAHFEAHFRYFWLVDTPRQSKQEYDDYTKK